jgi:Ca2+-binding EF-hand superfamily protein
MAEANIELQDNLKEAFNLFDEDGDGYITIDDLIKALKYLGKDPADPEMKDLMSEVKTETIDCQEFLDLMEKAIIGTDDQLRAAFNDLDKDGDGLLSADDIKQYLEKAFGDEVISSDEYAKKIMETCGNNDTQQLDYNGQFNSLLICINLLQLYLLSGFVKMMKLYQ